MLSLSTAFIIRHPPEQHQRFNIHVRVFFSTPQGPVEYHRCGSSRCIRTAARRSSSSTTGRPFVVLSALGRQHTPNIGIMSPIIRMSQRAARVCRAATLRRLGAAAVCATSFTTSTAAEGGIEQAESSDAMVRANIELARNATPRRGLYPAIEPHRTGMLRVSPVHSLYWDHR